MILSKHYNTHPLNKRHLKTELHLIYLSQKRPLSPPTTHAHWNSFKCTSTNPIITELHRIRLISTKKPSHSYTCIFGYYLHAEFLEENTWKDSLKGRPYILFLWKTSIYLFCLRIWSYLYSDGVWECVYECTPCYTYSIYSNHLYYFDCGLCSSICWLYCWIWGKAGLYICRHCLSF